MDLCVVKTIVWQHFRHFETAFLSTDCYWFSTNVSIHLFSEIKIVRRCPEIVSNYRHWRLKTSLYWFSANPSVYLVEVSNIPAQFQHFKIALMLSLKLSPKCCIGKFGISSNSSEFTPLVRCSIHQNTHFNPFNPRKLALVVKPSLFIYYLKWICV